MIDRVYLFSPGSWLYVTSIENTDYGFRGEVANGAWLLKYRTEEETLEAYAYGDPTPVTVGTSKVLWSCEVPIGGHYNTVISEAMAAYEAPGGPYKHIRV